MNSIEFWSRATNTTLFARNCNRSVKHVCPVFVSEALQMSLDNLKKIPQWIETSHRQNPITKGGPLKTLKTTLKGTGRVYRLYEHNSFSCLASFKNGYAYAMISQHTLKISTSFVFPKLVVAFFSSNNHAVAQRLVLLFCVL